MLALRLHALIAICSLSLFFVPALTEQLHGDVVLSGGYRHAPKGDDELEWLEIFNAGPTKIDSSSHGIGYAGTADRYGTHLLDNNIASGKYFMVGGPTSCATNGNPVFNQYLDFNSDIQKRDMTEDGVVLFNVAAGAPASRTVPSDFVLYGGANISRLIGESRSNGPSGGRETKASSSLTRDGSSSSITSNLTPGSDSITDFPEPAAAAALALAGGLFVSRRRQV